MRGGTVLDVPVTSTRNALLFVYISYFARYIQLLILVPFLGRVLGPAEYGNVLAAMSLFNIVWMVVQFGFPLVGVRDLAQAGTREAVARTLGTQIHGRCLTSLAGIGIGGLCIAFSPLLSEHPAYGVAAIALGVVSAFNLGWLFQALHRFRTSVLLEVAGFVITVALTLVLVRDSDDGLYALLALLASGVITLAAAYMIAAKDVPLRQMRSSDVKALMMESRPIFVVTGLPMLMTSASTYLLALFATPEEVGFFGAAERLAAVVLSTLLPAGQVLTAIVTRQLGDTGTQAHAYALMRKSMLAMVCFGVLACAGAWLLAPHLLPLILGPGFGQSVVILQVFALAFPLAAFSQAVRAHILFPLKEDRHVMASALVGALLNVLALFALAHEFGGIGVAVARVLGEVGTAAMLGVILMRTRIGGRVFGT